MRLVRKPTFISELAVDRFIGVSLHGDASLSIKGARPTFPPTESEDPPARTMRRVTHPGLPVPPTAGLPRHCAVIVTQGEPAGRWFRCKPTGGQVAHGRGMSGPPSRPGRRPTHRPHRLRCIPQFQGSASGGGSLKGSTEAEDSPSEATIQ